MKKTNFDLYLEQELKKPGFAKRFRRAGAAWDIILLKPRHRRAKPKNARSRKSRPFVSFC
jgi:hypothetical protein